MKEKEGILDFNVPSNFQPLWTCFGNIIRKIRNISLTYFHEHVSADVIESFKFTTIVETFCTEKRIELNIFTAINVGGV